MEALLMTISGAIVLILLIFFLALVWEEIADFLKRYWKKSDEQRRFKKRISKGLLSSRH